MKPSLSTVRDARELLRQHLPISRLVYAQSLTTKARTEVHLQLESDLPTGSFKPRGALYALSVNMTRRSIGEVTASSTRNQWSGRCLCRQRPENSGNDLSSC
jgi:threonine dehydratase